MPIGKMTKKNLWESGKGCFIGIDNGRSDYLCNFIPTARVGDMVEFEEGEPAKDGKPTLRKCHGFISKDVSHPIIATRDEDRPRTKDYRAHDYPQYLQEKDEKRMKMRLEYVRIAATMAKDGKELFGLADEIERYVKR